MPEQITAYRIFIASPGGLIAERNAFREVIAKCNEHDANERGVHFIPVGWEETLGGVGRPQSLINEDVKKCDYFVLLLHERWGSPSDHDPDSEYTSGTEEEYHVAWECYEDDGGPMRQIVAIFKAVAPERLADPGPQLCKVIEFKRTLEQEKKLLYQTFDVVDGFKDHLRAHLAQWVRDHENGTPAKVQGPPPMPAPEPVVPDAEPARTDEARDNDDLLSQAQRLAEEGNLIDAEAKFAKAIARGDSPDALNRYGHFLRRVGRLAQAEVMYDRILELTDLPDREKWSAIAHGNLGLVCQTRGETDRAEKMHRRSLELNQKLGQLEGMASEYGNLGLIHEMRGDLDQAEEMQHKALEIFEKLGRVEGMARAYGNLGLIHQTRGDLDQAEEMLRKALEIFERLGRLEGVAGACGNLGLIHETRGDLDQAEEMHRKSLEISERLGRLEGVAGAYGNLGLVYRTRGDLDQAEEMHRKSLEIEKRLGRLEGMATAYGNLGVIHKTRGDLDQAERMHRKSLELNENLGRLEGMATAYGNLGSVARARGEHDDARKLWIKARELFAKIGIPHMVKKVQGWIDELPPDDPR
ncbi:MAG: tetratricopeptide repeat protein [bacterium]|nr:tetratricopeptide repeat protein [bacterium]